jgi:hypothetical protein
MFAQPFINSAIITHNHIGGAFRGTLMLLLEVYRQFDALF